jgi:hypothetical protein
MEHFGPFGIIVAILLFCAIATVAGVVGDYKKRQAAMGPLRAAIERGQPLDPAVIERLMAPDSHGEKMDPLQLRVGGVITVASGVGVAVLSAFPLPVGLLTRYPVLGLGLLAICVGVGLLIAARVIERDRRNDEQRAD